MRSRMMKSVIIFLVTYICSLVKAVQEFCLKQFNQFQNCIFEVTCASSKQIYFSILEISPKKCAAHQKSNLLSLRLAHER